MPLMQSIMQLVLTFLFLYDAVEAVSAVDYDLDPAKELSTYSFFITSSGEQCL